MSFVADTHAERDAVVLRAIAYRDVLISYAYGNLRDWGLAEDAFQEAMTVVMQRWEDTREYSEIFVWLRTIVRFKCLEISKKLVRETPASPDEIDHFLDSTLTENWTSEVGDALAKRIAALRMCMQSISQKNRDLLVQFYANKNKKSGKERGGNSKERKEGADTRALRSKLYRIRKSLRKCIRQRLDDPSVMEDASYDVCLDALYHAGDTQSAQMCYAQEMPPAGALIRYLIGESALHIVAAQSVGNTALPTVQAPTSSFFSAALSVAAALTLAGGFWWWQVASQIGRESFAVVESVSGAVVDARGNAVEKGDAVKKGMRVITDISESVVVRYADGTRVTAEPESSVIFRGAREEGGHSIYLESGVLAASVMRQNEGESLDIWTADAVARVLGTELSVRAVPGQSLLYVESGEVEFRPAQRFGKRALVLSGERASIYTGAGGSVTLEKDLPLNAGLRGSLLREHWAKVGRDVNAFLAKDARYPDAPTSRRQVRRFAEPKLDEDLFFARYRGFLHPPHDGEYRFWIASDNAGVLYLSSDGTVEGKKRIAACSGSSNTDWDRHEQQQSRPIRLKKGNVYYIEATHHENYLANHLGVGWSGPEMDRAIIEGQYLSPWIDSGKE